MKKRLVNLTGNEVVISDSRGLICKIPSEGELKLSVVSHIPYPEHHIHYYDSSTDTEAGIPVFSAEKMRLDEMSSGYTILETLTKDDYVIVSLSVAQHIKLLKLSFKPKFFISCSKREIYGKECNSLQWFPIAI